MSLLPSLRRSLCHCCHLSGWMIMPPPSLPITLKCSSRHSLRRFPVQYVLSPICCRDSSYEISIHLPIHAVQRQLPPPAADAPFALRPEAAVCETVAAVPSFSIPCSRGWSRVVKLPIQHLLLPVSSTDPMPCYLVSPWLLIPMTRRVPPLLLRYHLPLFST